MLAQKSLLTQNNISRNFRRMTSQKFTTDWVTEEKVINWEIKNFTDLQNLKNPKNEIISLEFTAGESLGKSFKWKLEIRLTKPDEIGLYLMLRENLGHQSVYAAWIASLEYPESKDLVLTPDEKILDYNGGKSWGTDIPVTLEQLRNWGALVENTLSIDVKILIYKETTNKTTQVCSQKLLNENALDEMTKHFAALLETGDYSDFVIRVKKPDSLEYEEKKVHRAILSARNLVFKTMVESEMLENGTGVVTIADLTPTGLDILLKFIYTGTLDENWKLVPEEIVNAAEKYNLPLLKKHIDECLHTVCTAENAFTLFKVADTYGLQEASKNILHFMKVNFSDVVSKTLLQMY